MKRLYFYLKISLLFTYILPCSLLVSAQEKTGNETLALEYFYAADYEKALPLITELFKSSPDNAMYNYYYGIALLKTHHYETATKEALLNAVVSNTPSNVNFYLGNYFQALNNWGEALDFYARYKGSDQERSKLQFDKYVDLCRKKVNPFVVQETEKAVFTDTIKKVVPQPDEKNFPIPDALKIEWFNFQINSQVIYHRSDDFKSEAAKVLFTKAWLASRRNDSIVTATELLRKAHEQTTNVTTRLGLVDRIVDAEQKSYQLIRDREKYFDQARVKESNFWEKSDVNALNEFLAANSKREKEHDSILVAKNTHAEKELQATAESLNKENKTSVETPEEKEEKPATVNEMVYKVQIGTYAHGKVSSSFKTLYNKLSKLRKIDEYTDEKGNKIFTIGNFDNYSDANTLKNQLRLEGVKGPFVVAFKNGVKIPVTDAVKVKSSK
jgi:tetratricopeptide (TPR) repeat protein